MTVNQWVILENIKCSKCNKNHRRYWITAIWASKSSERHSKAINFTTSENNPRIVCETAWVWSLVTKLTVRNTFYFSTSQQDNNQKHKSHVVKDWLLYYVPMQLPHPPQSPDLNPIEHRWEKLERRIRIHHIIEKKSLKERFQEEWSRIGQKQPENL